MHQRSHAAELERGRSIKAQAHERQKPEKETNIKVVWRLAFLTFVASRLILPPTFTHLIKDVLFLKLQKIKHSLRGHISIFLNPLINHVNIKSSYLMTEMPYIGLLCVKFTLTVTTAIIGLYIQRLVLFCPVLFCLCFEVGCF